MFPEQKKLEAMARLRGSVLPPPSFPLEFDMAKCSWLPPRPMCWITGLSWWPSCRNQVHSSMRPTSSLMQETGRLSPPPMTNATTTTTTMISKALTKSIGTTLSRKRERSARKRRNASGLTEAVMYWQASWRSEHTHMQVVAQVGQPRLRHAKNSAKRTGLTTSLWNGSKR